MKKLIKSKSFLPVMLSVILTFVFAVVVVNAATTISTNISTAGTLTVTGASTLTGAVAASSTLQVTGATTLYSTLNVSGLTTLGNATTTLFTVLNNTYLGDADADTLTVRAGVWSLTSTATTTVAMTNGINFDSNTFVIDPNTNAIAIGTTTGANFIKGHVSNSASLTFGAIGASSCGTQTITVIGAADGDTVVLGIPNALATASTTIVFTGWVSAADTVTVRLCQIAATAGTFSAATVRADVWKH